MLQLTRQVDYGLRLMLEVAAHGEGPISTSDVAQQQEIPYEFLRKVARVLVCEGLLLSERGVGGGLLLARPAESITVLDIVRAFGPPSLNRCTIDPPRCERRDACVLFPVWVEGQASVERALRAAHLSDLAGRHASRRRVVGHRARRIVSFPGKRRRGSR